MDPRPLDAPAPHELALTLRSLMLKSPRPEIDRARRTTLGSPGRIFDACSAKDVPVVLIIFPSATS